MTENNKSEILKVTKENLFNYIKKFSFPRLSGTEGEKKAVGLTVNCFENIGFKGDQIEKEPFEFSDFYSTTLIKIIMLMSFNFILILRLASYIYPLVGVLCIAGMAVVVFLIIRGLKHPEDKGFFGEYFGKTWPSTNVFVKIPAKSLPSEKAGNIVISAHLDSKSQTFKTAWRIVLYRVWLFAGMIFGFFYLALLIYNFGLVKLDVIIKEIAEIGIWIVMPFILFSNLLLMFLNTHNDSPGALDNASGMSIVFELSAFFKDKPLDNFNLWFCQFSAEELGTMGSRVFVNNHEKQFVKGRVFQINMDMVSRSDSRRNRVEYLKSYGVLPRKKLAPLLSKYLNHAADEEKLKIKGFHLSTGAHLDSVPFHIRHFDVVDITTRAAAKHTHNKVDTPDKTDPAVLLQTYLIVRKSVLLLDSDYDKLCKTKELECEETLIK